MEIYRLSSFIPCMRLGLRLKQLSERHSEAVCDAAIGKPRFKGKRKREKREKSPW